jgi:hypothetical protein
VKFQVEILKFDGADPPTVILTFSHSAKSVELVQETLNSVHYSPSWPPGADGYRIAWVDGIDTHRVEINLRDRGTS